MLDYRPELERRIAQFASCLQPMNRRAHEVAQASCFLVFDEKLPTDRVRPELVDKQEFVLEEVGQSFGHMGFFKSEANDSDSLDLPNEGWREDETRSRFIQFSMENKWFCMDLPRQTLYRPEAEEILRQRNGFFYLRDRKQFTLYGEDAEGCDPFRKIYVYADEESAATDMAFVFFQIWKFPVDSRFYVTSASFNGKHRWEDGAAIE